MPDARSSLTGAAATGELLASCRRAGQPVREPRTPTGDTHHLQPYFHLDDPTREEVMFEIGIQGMFFGLAAIPLLFAALLTPLFAGLALSKRLSKRRLPRMKTAENPFGLF
jgi:hypothetical protein